MCDVTSRVIFVIDGNTNILSNGKFRAKSGALRRCFLFLFLMFCTRADIICTVVRTVRATKSSQISQSNTLTQTFAIFPFPLCTIVLCHVAVLSQCSHHRSHIDSRCAEPAWVSSKRDSLDKQNHRVWYKLWDQMGKGRMM